MLSNYDYGGRKDTYGTLSTITCNGARRYPHAAAIHHSRLLRLCVRLLLSAAAAVGEHYVSA